jgi:hypothetical protein
MRQLGGAAPVPSCGTGAMSGKHNLVGIYHFVFAFCFFYIWCIVFHSFIINTMHVLCECAVLFLFSVDYLEKPLKVVVLA